MRALEPRMLFDGAVAATVADAAQPIDAQPDNAHADDTLAATPQGVTDQRHEVVFIDGNVRDYQQLLAGMPSGTEVVVLDSGADGLQQMADYLQGRTGIDAVHVLSHGDAGKIQLGNQWLDGQQLQARSDLLAAIGESLSDDGDILLYGCNVGADTVGIDFIGSLAAATGADVAASGDATGAAVLGGDWVLEARRGEIEAATLVLADYQGLLAAPTSENFDGVALSGGYNLGTPGAPRVINGWTFTLLDATGAQDANGYVDVTNVSNDTSLANNGSDAATLLNGNYTASTGQAAAVFKASTGEEFSFTSIRVEIGYSGGNDYRLVGYRDGVAVAGATQNFTAGTYGSGGTLVTVSGTAWQYLDEVRIVRQGGQTDVSIYIDDIVVAAAIPPNAAPVITNLNGDSVSWAGAGNTVTLDLGGNASFSDAELMALNGGNGNWAGASLTVQHPTSPIAADIFGFNTAGALFTVSGNNLQAGGDTFATFTNTGGVLTVSFTSSVTAATTALVNDVAQRITYRNDTPGGDTPIRFTLSDGSAAATANVTVTSDTIYVTNATDTATINRSNGVSFSEAVAIAAADATGIQTIVFDSSLAGQTLSLSNVSINETLTLNLDAASGVTLTGGSLAIGGSFSLIITNGTGDTATIATTLTGSGNLAMFGSGTLTLSGNNSYSGSTNVAAGTLSIGSDSNLGSDTVIVGATLRVTGTTTIDNNIALTYGNIDTSATTTLSGVVSGSALGKLGTGTLILSGNNTYTGITTVDAGTLQVTGSTAGATTVSHGATLAGTGTLGGDVTVSSGGTLAPGNGGVGALTINGDLTMNAGSTLAVEINGSVPGSGYDQVIVNGMVNLSNATIAATHGYVPVGNDSYRIIDNDAADAVTGTFNGVAEGGTLTAGGNSTVLAASYTGGTGNDITLTVVVNEAPVIGNLNGDSVGYLEGYSPILLDAGSNATLTDTDSADFDGGNVTATFTANHVPGEDVLSIIHTGTGAGQIGLSGSTVLYGGVAIGTYAGGSGNNPLVITLNANSTPAAVQALLRNLAYSNGNNADPSTSTRSVSITVNDGDGGTSASATVSVSVTGVNDAPTITATGNNPTYTENGSAVDLFSSVSINTVETGQTIAGMTLTVTNLADGSDEILRIDGTDIALLNGSNGTTAGNGISYSISLVGGTATITLSSAGGVSATTAQTVVDGMSYRNGSDAPSTTTRVITLTSITDSGGTANGGVDTAATSIATSVSVIAVNDAPIVTSSGGSSTFTEGDSNTVIDSGLTLSDPDNGTLSSATVSITSNFQLGADVLIFVNDGSTMGNITANYNAGTGVLTLTSAGATATLAQWQAALRSVTYSNGSDAPSTANRTISFIANDGQDDSTAATKIVSVTAVNDAPQITAPVSIGVTEDIPSAITGISFSDADAGSANVTVTLSVGSGTLSAASGGGVTVGGTASALTLTGSIADINSFIAGSNLSFTTAANATANVTLTVNINDGGNTGSGGAENASETITLQVAAVNDAPTITAPGSIAITEDIPGALTGISFTDVDAGSGNVTVTFSVPSGTLSATSGSGVTVGGTASALTLTGSLADINAFIAASGISFTTASNATANATLTVTIDDGGNTGSGGAQTDTTSVTLMVTAVNDAPVNSVPTAQNVDQDDDLVFNSVNGNLISISDVDAGASNVEVTLAATNGLLTLGSTTGLIFTVGSGSNAATMAFSGSIADINNALNGLVFSPTGGYNGPASLQITTNDLGNSGSGGAQTDTDTISITVNSLIPRITDVSASTADGTYKVGDTITITATFSEAVTVDTTGGIPTLLLETGSIDRLATYVSGSGGNTLTFIYTVQPGDLSADLNYQSTVALSLNGATIRGATANDAVLTLPSLGDLNSLAGNKAIVIDGIAPLVGSVSVPANGTYVAGQDLNFTVNFSENVVVDTTGGTPRIAVTLDTGSTVFADYVSGSGTSALVFRLTVASGQADSNGIVVGSAIQANGGSLRDAAGNNAVITLNSVGATTGVLVDAADPTVVSVAVPPAGAYAAGSVLTFTVNLSEAVTVDTTGGTPRLLLDIGGHSVYADYVSGSGSSALVFTYTVQPGDTDGDGIAVSALASNGGTLQDAVGNAMDLNLVGIGNTGGVLIDTTAPAAIGITRIDASPTGSSSVSYTVTFSESVSGVDASDFSLIFTGSASGSIASVTTLNGQTYVVVVNGITGSGTLGLNLRNGGTGIADNAGNALGGGLTGPTYAIDRALPAVSSVAVPANGTYVAGQNLDFTVNFSESVVVDSSGGTPRIAVTLDTGGTVYANYVAGSGSNALTFRLTVATGQFDGNGIDLGNSIQLNGATLKGSSGNDVATALAGIGSTAGVRVDAQDPTAAIVPTGTSPTSANTLEFRVTFNENVTGVDAGDFSLLTGGTVQGTLQSVVQLDARTYQVVVTGVSGSGSLQLALNAPGSGIADAAGNRLGGSVVSSGYEIRQIQPEPEPEPEPKPRPQPEGDPEFRVDPPVSNPDLSTPLPQVAVPGGTAPSFTSPLLPPPLFEVPTLGGGLPPLGNIFINRGALAPSFIAQVFASSHSDAGGDGSGMGFLGFGGGDAGVFGSSSLSSIFGKDVLQETEQLKIFDGKQWSDGAEGAIFGAPPLSQQLHELREGERRQLHELALALGQIHAEGPKA